MHASYSKQLGQIYSGQRFVQDRQHLKQARDFFRTGRKEIFFRTGSLFKTGRIFIQDKQLVQNRTEIYSGQAAHSKQDRFVQDRLFIQNRTGQLLGHWLICISHVV